MNRKELESIRADLAMARHFANSDIAVHAVERAEAALAVEESTLRECDVGTTDEQADRYRHFCSAFATYRDCSLANTAGDPGLPLSRMPCSFTWLHTVHTPDFQELANQAGPPREPHVATPLGQEPEPREHDVASIPTGMIGGVDLGYTDAGCNVAASPAPTVTERFELPF